MSVRSKGTCPKCSAQVDVVDGLLVGHKFEGKGKVCPGSASKGFAARPQETLPEAEYEPPLTRRDTQGRGQIEMTRAEMIEELKAKLRAHVAEKPRSLVLKGATTRSRDRNKVTEKDMGRMRKEVGDDEVDLLVAVMLRAVDPDQEIRALLRELRNRD